MSASRGDDGSSSGKGKGTSNSTLQTAYNSLQLQLRAVSSNSAVKKFVKNYRTELAAGGGAFVSTLLMTPFDFTKSRMQSYETSLIHTIKDAYKAEGLRAFWRGSIPPLVSITMVKTINFSFYDKAKHAFDGTITSFTGQSPLQLANANGGYPSASTMLCFGAAGAVSGAVITPLSCPFELTRLNEQLAGKEARKKAMQSIAPGMTAAWTSDRKAHSWATAKRLVRDRGIFGLYAGFRLHLLRDSLGTSIYFMTYESVKQLTSNARGKEPANPAAVAFAGGFSGVVSWSAVRRSPKNIPQFTCNVKSG